MHTKKTIHIFVWSFKKKIKLQHVYQYVCQGDSFEKFGKYKISTPRCCIWIKCSFYDSPTQIVHASLVVGALKHRKCWNATFSTKREQSSRNKPVSISSLRALKVISHPLLSIPLTSQTGRVIVSQGIHSSTVSPLGRPNPSIWCSN